MAIFVIFLLALCSSTISEYIQYLLVYSKKEYLRILNDIKRETAESEGADVAPTLAKKKHKQKKMMSTKTLQKLNAQLVVYNLKMAVTNIGIIISSYQILNRMYSGVVVGILPFEPFSLFTSITHRGLEGENYRECSSQFIFVLSLMFVRGLVGKVLEAYKIKPEMPKQPSMWEMAEKEASKIQ